MLTVGKPFFDLIGDGEIIDAFEISNLTDLTKTYFGDSGLVR